MKEKLIETIMQAHLAWFIGVAAGAALLCAAFILKLNAIA